jgi:hypothetical protein
MKGSGCGLIQGTIPALNGYINFPMLRGSFVTMAWHVLMLWMEEASRSGG